VASKIKLLIADDHPIVRKGLLSTVGADPGIKVIAEAQNGEEALRLIREHKPDVAVLDIDMPKLDGLGVAREVSKLSLGTRIIFLTLHKDADLFRAAIQAGATGYLLKDSAMQELVAGVKAVALGQQFVSAALVSLFVEVPLKRPASPPEGLLGRLTPTEREILERIANGRSSKEIGEDLSIHYRTVENHRTNICKKLGIEGANALLRFALQHKLGTPGGDLAK
jgi:DNA-binding NarL/FixJ family response regulator